MSEKAAQIRDWARWVTALIGVGGVIIAWFLTDMYIDHLVGEQDVGGQLCDAADAFGCENLWQLSQAEIAGIPISLLGLAFYSAVVALAVFDRDKLRGSSRPFRPAAIAATTFGIGVVYSIYLATVSYTVPEQPEFCPYCMMLYGVNILGFVAASLWAGALPHRLLFKQIKDVGSVANRWTGLFVFAFVVMLFAGIAIVEHEQDDRRDTVADQQVEYVDLDDIDADDAPAKGAGEDAPVQIVEFSSFGCPFCADFGEELDRLVDEYGDVVRVEYRYFPLPNQTNAHEAARAAHCAHEQQRFWPMAELLYDNRDAHDEASLKNYAEQLGLNIDRFEACLTSDQTRRRVDQDLEQGSHVGVESTPTFFVNGQMVRGKVPFEQLEQIVLQELDEGS